MEDLPLFKELQISSKVRQYHVAFGNDSIGHLRSQLKAGDFIIIDENVAKLYPKLLQALEGFSVYQLSPNEAAKSYDKIGLVVEQIVDAGFRRDNTLFAIGGGIVQDISSFVSFIIYRGVDWVFYPTNLLSQCDSCIGSKISVNLGNYKNLLGGFYPPKFVYINTGFLKTLGKDDVLSGLGEMLHYFLVSSEADAQLFSELAPIVKNDLSKIETLIFRSLEIKKAMVEVDEFDRGPRHVFNYGHSFGHALESATGYTIPHGIAVAYGIDLANLVSVHLGLLPAAQRNRMRELCATVFESRPLPSIDMKKYESALRKDKKNRGSQLGLILSKGIGQTFKTNYNYEDIGGVIENFFENKNYLQLL